MMRSAPGLMIDPRSALRSARSVFIHCSRGIEQVRTVLSAHYAQVDAPLVLLHIDEDSLSSAALHIVDEPVDPDNPDAEVFPHIYGGALPTGFVAEVLPLEV